MGNIVPSCEGAADAQFCAATEMFALRQIAAKAQ
jgi:hypothetical protein